MAKINLDNLEKRFPGGQVAVENLNLEIADGEFLVLVGPSGCGKSTTLRMIAGLETPTKGSIKIGEQDVTALPPQKRDLAMVFQNYALYPHMTVRANLEFGLRMRKTSHQVIQERVEKVADILGLKELLNRKPAQLSGGQRQRVALGRAIVREPKAFLLDEPLSNLDAKLRVQTRAELTRMHRKLGATMIYVTHDQEEAMTLGDRVAVLLDGRLQQVAPPMEIYRTPANVFVASFVGSPAMNFFACTARQAEGGIELKCPFFSLKIAGTNEQPLPAEIKLGIRPQDVKLANEEEAEVTAEVDVVQPLGSDKVAYLNLVGNGETQALTMLVPAASRIEAQDTVPLYFPREHLHLFDERTEKRL